MKDEMTAADIDSALARIDDVLSRRFTMSYESNTRVVMGPSSASVLSASYTELQNARAVITSLAARLAAVEGKFKDYRDEVNGSIGAVVFRANGADQDTRYAVLAEFFDEVVAATRAATPQAEAGAGEEDAR